MAGSQPKASLTKELTPQVEQLVQSGGVKEPHPYLLVWIGCKNASTEYFRVLPDSGGWFDQNAEVMIALDICEQAYQIELKLKHTRDEISNSTQKKRNPPTI